MCSYPISGLLFLFVIISVFCKKKKKKSKQITLVTNELSLIVVRHDKKYVIPSVTCFTNREQYFVCLHLFSI